MVGKRRSQKTDLEIDSSPGDGSTEGRFVPIHNQHCGIIDPAAEERNRDE